MGVDDVVITDDFWGLTLRTLGDVVIEANASAALKRIEASGSVIVRGALQAQVRAGRALRIECGAYWRGSGQARTLDIHRDANVRCFYDTGGADPA
jgi:hypothetical protein